MEHCTIIAEIAQAHDGSVGIAHSYIDALAQTGVDVIKFQTHIADAESSAQEPFRVHFSYEDGCRMDYWKRMEFTEDQWIGLKRHCDEKGVEFLSSPFSIAAVDLLERVGVLRYKIGSGEVNNLLLLDRIAQTKKPVILSSGLSKEDELTSAISAFRHYPAYRQPEAITLLHCKTAYPTTPNQWDLSMIPALKQRYGVPVGFSDHSGGIFAGLAAAALGAVVIEVHAVFDNRMFGPDAKASLTVDQVAQLVVGVRQISQGLSTHTEPSEEQRINELKAVFEKSLAVNKELKKGTIISIDDLESKKPKGLGIDAADYKKIVGKRVAHDMHQWDFIKPEDLV